jgi:nucleotide-binding universal stress UspA family protein
LVNDTQQRITVHDRQQLFVIGISGSSASLAALMWAASEARRRNAALRVVHVWEPVRRLAPYAVPVGSPAAAQDRLAACRLLTGAMRETFGPATPDGVTTELAEGAPERLLVRRSTGADLLVLGATASLDDPLRRSSGPVARACLANARCPLMIIATAAGPAAIPLAVTQST